MLSLKTQGRLARLACAATLALGLAGCFQPLYAPTASGGDVAKQLASIEVKQPAVAPGQERISHYLRNELVFDLDGSGEPAPKSLILETTVTERLDTATVNTQTGRADAAILTGRVDYTLKPLAGSTTVITSGTALASATYDRSVQRFATVRAARDAEIRVAKELAEQIKTRVAAILASR